MLKKWAMTSIVDSALNRLRVKLYFGRYCTANVKKNRCVASEKYVEYNQTPCPAHFPLPSPLKKENE